MQFIGQPLRKSVHSFCGWLTIFVLAFLVLESGAGSSMGRSKAVPSKADTPKAVCTRGLGTEGRALFTTPEDIRQADLYSLVAQLPERDSDSSFEDEKPVVRAFYGIPAGTDAIGWYWMLIRNCHQSQGDLVANIEGDAHHRIGHILESRGEIREAGLSFVRALEAYKKSAIPYSPGVSFLDTRVHAAKHLVILFSDNQLQIPREFAELYNRPPKLSDFEIARQMAQYRATVQILSRGP